MNEEKTKAAYSQVLRDCANIADERAAQYGDLRTNFQDISDICKTAFGLTLTPVQVVQVMIAVKLARELHKPKSDNRKDAVNYMAILDFLLEDAQK